MEFLAQLALTSFVQTWQTFTTNWPFLFFSLILAVLLKNLLKPEKITAFLERHQKAGVVGATTLAVTTPFCSCGTTAVILGMMANSMPWAPIVAFMVASPLTSPEELVYSAGLFGWRFAGAFFVSSILLGLAGGVLGGMLDRSGWLKGQARMRATLDNSRSAAAQVEKPQPAAPQSTGYPLSVLHPSSRQPTHRPAGVLATGAACCAANLPVIQPLVLLPQPVPVTSSGSFSPAMAIESQTSETSCSCGSNKKALENPVVEKSCSCSSKPEEKPREEFAKNLVSDAFRTGRQLLLLFFAFSLIGHFLNGLIPAAWITAIFGSGKVYGVPLAATLGLPLYVNTEASLPLVRTMLDAGMSQGAALAFLITGAGTSFGAVAGALTIARWRVIALVIGTLWAGAILMGFAYNLVF